jgi:hypothetical protein
MLNILRSLVGAARSFFRTQKSLGLENLALGHQMGVLKRTVGKPRLCIGPADRALWATPSRVFDGWEQPPVAVLAEKPVVVVDEEPGRLAPGGELPNLLLHPLPHACCTVENG